MRCLPRRRRLQGQRKRGDVYKRQAVVLKNKVATKFSRSTWGNVSGFSPIFLPRAKDQSVRGKIMPVREITRNAVPQFLTSSGTVNVSLSTKIAEVAMRCV